VHKSDVTVNLIKIKRNRQYNCKEERSQPATETDC